MEFTDRRVERTIRLISIVAVFVTLYYLYWRIVYTFNPNALFFSWALYGAEVFGAITTFLFYFTVWKPTSRTAPPPLPGRSVDVFIPTKSEAVGVLRKTLLACNDLKYPHRTVVLDDGNRAEVKALCEELRCVYLAREKHENAKAGNINFGLQNSSAEFIAIFDADHVPLSHFIDRLIGYFKDEKIGFVQVPQEFYNIDSFQHRVDRKNKSIWGEQHLFFSLIQPGRDHWNAGYFVGSCAILRRKALDDIGGIATGSITEDMLTSIRLHAKGWASVYHNEYLAYGIAAETLKPFHIQRQRWGVGNWQAFVKANPLFIRGLTLPQRLCYFSSMIYPLEGIQKMIFYVTPPIALFSGVLPMKALDVNYLVHFVPYFLVSIFGFNQMARGFGGQMLLEQFSMGKFFTYLGTLVIPFIPKKGKEFKVTPKGKGESRVPFSLIIPQVLVFLGSLTAIAWALIQLVFEMRRDSFIVAVNSFWALYNSGLALAIIQYDYKKLFQRRGTFRIPDAVPSLYQSASSDNTRRRLAVADNITEEGLSLIAIGQVPVGQELMIDLLLPTTTLHLDCQVVQQKSVMAEKYPLSHLGLRFKGVPQDAKNILSRYLSQSAVTKFMREYRIGSKTYVEKRFTSKYFHERAYRSLTYLPVIIGTEAGRHAYAVMKDISKGGLLLASRVSLQQGSEIKMDVILGIQKLLLRGTVVRNFAQGNEDYPEYLLGVHIDEASHEQITNLLAVADKIGSFILE